MNRKFMESWVIRNESLYTVKNITNLSKEVISTLLSLTDYVEEVNSYLLQRGWKFDYRFKNFYKVENNIEKDFRSLSKPKNKITPSELANLFTDHNGNINHFHNLDIINSYTDTDFVVSWIQHAFVEDINGRSEWFLHQPVIRLNGDSKWDFFVSWNEWIWTSFINTTKYSFDADASNLIEWLEDFFDFLSKIWIFIGDVSLKFKLKNDIRNGKDVFIFMIHIFYWSLNIWDASLIQNFNSWLVKDLGFWLERLNVARNKYVNYFEQYLNDSNLLNRFSDNEIDAIKTLCLLLTSKDRIFKKSWSRKTYLKLMKKLNKNKNYYPLIKIFQDYWSNFWAVLIDSTILLEDIEKYTY